MSTAQYQFTTSRIFDAPRDTVWSTWTEEKHLARWFAPKGFSVISSSLDFEVGGAYRYGLDSGLGFLLWGKWEYREIVFGEKIVAVVAFTDEGGEKVVAHPLQSNWPLEVLSMVTFTDLGMKTEVHVVWESVDSSDAAQVAFREGTDAMEMGWTGTFDSLNDYLEDLTTPS